MMGSSASNCDYTRHAQKSEKALEAYLVRRVSALGGVCRKHYSAADAGWPDRECLMPGGRVLQVELKSKGCKPRALQGVRIAWLRGHGHEAYVCDSREAIDAALAGREAGE